MHTMELFIGMILAMLCCVHAAPTGNATTLNFGGVVLFNGCGYPVVHTTVVDNRDQEHGTIAPGKWYFEPYHNPHDGAVSIKLGKNALPTQPLSQLEYNWAGPQKHILWYDLSNVNCGPTSTTNRGPCPFLKGGMHLQLDKKGCPARTCHRNDVYCEQAFNRDFETWVIAKCLNVRRHNLVLHLCREN